MKYLEPEKFDGHSAAHDRIHFFFRRLIGTSARVHSEHTDADRIQIDHRAARQADMNYFPRQRNVILIPKECQEKLESTKRRTKRSNASRHLEGLEQSPRFQSTPCAIRLILRPNPRKVQHFLKKVIQLMEQKTEQTSNQRRVINHIWSLC